MQLWHFGWSTADRFPLFSTEQQQRAYLRRLVRNAGRSIAVFGTADDHAHVAAAASEEARPRLSRCLTMTLEACAERPLAPVHIERVEGRRHLSRLVRYLHEQPRHHGLSTHPAAWSGSSFPDLVGARVIPGFQPVLWDAMPRLRVPDVGRGLGLSPEDWAPVDDDRLRDVGLEALVGAASFATCADPALRGQCAEVVRARLAVVHLGWQLGYSTRALAEALSLSHRGVRALRARDVAPGDLLATRHSVTLLDRFGTPIPASTPEPVRPSISGAVG